MTFCRKFEIVPIDTDKNTVTRRNVLTLLTKALYKFGSFKEKRQRPSFFRCVLICNGLKLFMKKHYTGSLAPADFSGAVFTCSYFQIIAQIFSLCGFHYICAKKQQRPSFFRCSPMCNGLEVISEKHINFTRFFFHSCCFVVIKIQLCAK